MMFSHPISKYCVLYLFVPILFFISCTTVKNSTHADRSSGQSLSATILPLPSATDLASSRIDPQVQADMEIGSPASIRSAVTRVYSTSQGLTKEKQLQLTLAARLMRLLYPFETIDWNAPNYQQTDPYLDALTQIEKGLYPQNLGMNTFFDAVIPAIILTKGVGVQEYADALEKRLFIARNLNPSSVLPSYLLGLLYEQRGKLSDAENYYQMAWEQDESCYPAGMRFAYLALFSNNIETSYKIAEKLYTRHPNAVTIQLLLAETYLEKGNLEKAEEIVSAVLKKNNDFGRAFFLQVRLHIEKKEYLAANAMLDEFAKQNKVDKDYLLLRHRMLLEWSKNIAEAKQCLERAASFYPQSPDVVLACANFCFETKNTVNGKTANDFINALLKQNPRNILAIRLLVKEDIAEKRWGSAFERAQYLYENNPSEEDIVLYARVCAGMNNWEEAVTTAQAAYNAVSKQPSDEIITLYLQALYGAKKYGMLVQVINRHLSDARSALKSVLIYYQSLLASNDEDNLALLRSSLLSDPRSSLTLFALYEWYFRHKDYRKAYYYLQQVIALDPYNKTYLQLAEKLERLQ
ncbi:tetratricopeptide repeat protein [Treponema sp. OMZ 857]|uniref:tetratricopeptide repeat protein n=1 Tax=Treponema sp. OMZ 857 TaxID=1643513 RepID=UPI0020A525E3|nr:tetratricopeptide repeat protein [Treponema sp. OMZ 857]